MAISVTNITRPGANLQVGQNQQIGTMPAATNPLALHVEEYTGVVEGTLERSSIMRQLIPTRSVRGTSTITAFQFGESTLQKLVPGQIMDSTVNQAARIKLVVDTVVAARATVPMIDEFQNSYDARKHIGEEHGKVLAKFYDEAFLIQVIKAAQISNMSTYPAGWKPGTVKTFATPGLENDPSALEDYLGQVFVDMMEKDVDPITDGMVVVMSPKAHHTLLKNDRLVDRTYITSDNTDIRTKHMTIYGVPVLTSNNLPKTNITNHFLSNDGNNHGYNGNFTKTVAAVFSPRALLAGETIPVTTELFNDPLSKSYFVDAYTSFGVAPNNPAFAGLLKAA